MKRVAATGLDGDAAQLHAAADDEYWDTTPLSTACTTDNDTISAYSEALSQRYYAWQEPLASLTPSGDFPTDAAFHWAPKPDFFHSAGLGPWLGQRFWTAEDSFYDDPTPLAGDASARAATTLGNHEHDWFGTAGVFEWVAEFVRARVGDPAIREELRRDALSGYLFLGELPDPTRNEVLRALRDDLIPAMAAEPDRTPVFEQKVRELAALASR